MVLTSEAFLEVAFLFIYLLFYLVFTPCKAEQPLRGMELQENEAEKG